VRVDKLSMVVDLSSEVGVIFLGRFENNLGAGLREYLIQRRFSAIEAMSAP
jgi:hypothetical protein